MIMAQKQLESSQPKSTPRKRGFAALESKDDCDSRDDRGSRDEIADSTKKALQEAIEKGDLSAVITTLESFNISASTDPGSELLNVALIKAALTGNESIVSKLISSGADVNEIHEHGVTALKAGIASNCWQMVEMLLVYRAKVNPSLRKTEDSPLNFALKAGFKSDPVIGCDTWNQQCMTDTKIIKLLLDNAARVNQKCVEGYLPLSLAAASNRDAIVKHLLKKGAAVNQTDDKYAMTPLMHAAVAGNSYIVNLLLLQEANIDDANRWGYTPLLLAVQMKKRDAVISLLDRGADPNKVSPFDGVSALILATEADNIEIMEALLFYGADVNYRKPIHRRGTTALMLASQLGFRSALAVLLSHNADVHLRDEDGNTAMTLTSDVDICKVLTHAGLEQFL